jgi:hypothetical protein
MVIDKLFSEELHDRSYTISLFLDVLFFDLQLDKPFPGLIKVKRALVDGRGEA